MNKAILLLAPALMLASCGEAATKEADKPEAKVAKAETVAVTSAGAAFVPQGDLNDAQKAIAIEMHDLVRDYAILARLQEKCPEYAADEAKMGRARDLLIEESKPAFPNKEDFLIAAGRNQQEAMGEEMRQFFAKQGVSWDAPSPEYCAVGKTLKGQATGPGRFLR